MKTAKIKIDRFVGCAMIDSYFGHGVIVSPWGQDMHVQIYEPYKSSESYKLTFVGSKEQKLAAAILHARRKIHATRKAVAA